MSDQEIVIEHNAGLTTTENPKPRGRPKGSKNRIKVKAQSKPKSVGTKKTTILAALRAERHTFQSKVGALDKAIAALEGAA